MSESISQLLADSATALVRESFTGVRAEWWWERRMGGGIEVCQELDPEAMAREIAGKTAREPAEVRRAIEEEIGLEAPEPVVLTFEIPHDATAADAARLLAQRSATPEGLAAPLYRRVEEALKNEA